MRTAALAQQVVVFLSSEAEEPAAAASSEHAHVAAEVVVRPGELLLPRADGDGSLAGTEPLQVARRLAHGALAVPARAHLAEGHGVLAIGVLLLVVVDEFLLRFVRLHAVMFAAAVGLLVPSLLTIDGWVLGCKTSFEKVGDVLFCQCLFI